ncbi:MAG: DUF669 domain-containing protein [Bullifex sp.]
MQLPCAVQSQEYSNRVPDGTYQVIISECIYGPGRNDPNRFYLSVKMIVTGGQSDGMFITDRFCLAGPPANEKEVRVGNSRLGGLMFACGFPKGMTMQDSDELLNRRCTCTAKTTVSQDGKENQGFFYKAPEAPAPIESQRPPIQAGGYTPPQQSSAPQQGYTYTSNPSWGK